MDALQQYSQPRKVRPPVKDTLSPRELQVLELLGRALSAKGIGRELGLTMGTVKWHLKNIYGKLDAGSREVALAKARARKIVP